MSKYLVVLFTIIHFNASGLYSQASKDSTAGFGTVIIDRSIEKKFFKAPPQRVESNVGKVRINSYIRDTAKSRPLFDSCRCYFKNDDTLIIKFKELLSLDFDTINIKVSDDTYWAIYISRGGIHPAVSGSLKFRHKPHRKGQEIFGELGLEFIQNDQNSTRFFKGPFRCTIE